MNFPDDSTECAIMLKHLAIKDFVIVDRIELDFMPGFTVLTGETKGGKIHSDRRTDACFGGARRYQSDTPGL